MIRKTTSEILLLQNSDNKEQELVLKGEQIKNKKYEFSKNFLINAFRSFFTRATRSKAIRTKDIKCKDKISFNFPTSS